MLLLALFAQRRRVGLIFVRLNWNLAVRVGSIPSQRHCVVFLGNILNSQCAFQMRTSGFNTWVTL